MFLSCFDKEKMFKDGNGKAFAGRKRYVDISCQKLLNTTSCYPELDVSRGAVKTFQFF